MDRLSDRGSIPLRSIFEKPWKSLISGVFCYLVERKNAVLNRFNRFRVEKLMNCASLLQRDIRRLLMENGLI